MRCNRVPYFDFHEKRSREQLSKYVEAFGARHKREVRGLVASIAGRSLVENDLSTYINPYDITLPSISGYYNGKLLSRCLLTSSVSWAEWYIYKGIVNSKTPDNLAEILLAAKLSGTRIVCNKQDCQKVTDKLDMYNYMYACSDSESKVIIQDVTLIDISTLQ